MRSRNQKNWSNCRNRSGLVLLVTLVLLVVLSTLGYTLTSRIAAQRHRDQYIIDYQAARYGCDSAVKYALATLEDVNSQLISRPDEPDFSDLFSLSEVEYEELLAQWAVENALDTGESLADIDNVDDINNVGGIADFNTESFGTPADSDSLTVRGPYGPAWPFITEPVEFEIGSATVSIQIEDENAKYPIGWAMLDDELVQREAEAGLDTFCEWMGVEDEQIESLKLQLENIAEIKPFKLKLKKITTRTPVKRSERARGTKTARGKRTRAPRFKRATIFTTAQIADSAKLFHSSLIDTEALARPTIISDSRKESPLKYMGMWASRKVNINTAPRHVLEAAFTFGGDADKIAEEIILRRRIKPFEDIAKLKEELFRYSDSIGKCEKYITTASTFFTIKVTAVSGVAEASAVVAITKNGKKVERIAVINSG